MQPLKQSNQNGLSNEENFSVIGNYQKDTKFQKKRLPKS